MSSSLSIILPTYNEVGNIVQLINELHICCSQHRIAHEIIVVDDKSPDHTARVAHNAFHRKKWVRVFVRRKDKGLARSILFGIRHAHSSVIVVMDTDFNHHPKVVPLLFNLTKQRTLVIGSRYVSGGGMENKLRQHLSFLFNLYLRILLGHGVRDNLSGYFAIKKSDLNKLPLDALLYGFGDYFIRLIYCIYRQGWTIIETPVFYQNRTYGVSKSRFITMFVTYTKTALKLRVNSL